MLSFAFTVSSVRFCPPVFPRCVHMYTVCVSLCSVLQIDDLLFISVCPAFRVASLSATRPVSHDRLCHKYQQAHEYWLE